MVRAEGVVVENEGGKRRRRRGKPWWMRADKLRTAGRMWRFFGRYLLQVKRGGWWRLDGCGTPAEWVLEVGGRGPSGG